MVALGCAHDGCYPFARADMQAQHALRTGGNEQTTRQLLQPPWGAACKL